MLASGNNGFNLELAYEIAKSITESFEANKLRNIYLVIYSGNIANFIRSKATEVINLQCVSLVEDGKNEYFSKFKQFSEESKNVAKKNFRGGNRKGFSLYEG